MTNIYSVIRSYKTVNYVNKEVTVNLVEFESENFQEAIDFKNNKLKNKQEWENFRVEKNIRVRENNNEIIEKIKELFDELVNPEDETNENEYGWSDYKDTQQAMEEFREKIQSLYYRLVD